MSAIGTGPSPMWQSNTNYNFSKYYMTKDISLLVYMVI